MAAMLLRVDSCVVFKSATLVKRGLFEGEVKQALWFVRVSERVARAMNEEAENRWGREAATHQGAERTILIPLDPKSLLMLQITCTRP